MFSQLYNRLKNPAVFRAIPHTLMAGPRFRGAFFSDTSAQVWRETGQALAGFLLGLALLGGVEPVQGGVYYVSPGGLNSNPGTASQPWATVQQAANVMLPGDTVRVQPGHYPEIVRVQKTNGTHSARITFKGDGPVRVNGFYVLVDGVTIDGFEMRDDPVNLFDGAIRVHQAADYLWVFNNRFQGYTNRYGVLFVAGGVNPQDSSQSCVISNNVFDTIGCINVNLFGKNHLVVSNYFANTFGEGDAIRAWGSDHYIRGNIMTNIGGGPEGVRGGHPDLIQSFGLYQQAAYNIVFENNFVINSLAQICQISPGTQDPTTGVFYYGDIRDFTFRNNIFINVSYAANTGGPGIWFYNNLFYRCTTNTAHVIAFSDGSTGRGQSDRSGAKNNIFLECGANPSSQTFGWYMAPTNLVDLDCDFNYVAGTGFSPKRTDSVRSMWRFVEANGQNGGDPKFWALGTLDFRLTADSRLRGSGVVIPSFGIDFSYQARPLGGPWDIGPYQYIGSQTVVPPLNLKVSSFR